MCPPGPSTSSSRAGRGCTAAAERHRCSLLVVVHEVLDVGHHALVLYPRYLPGPDLFLDHILPSVYAGLVRGGFFMHEGPIGAGPLANPAPAHLRHGLDLDSPVQMLWLDVCRLLVATGHFALVEDVRYHSGWSMRSDLDGQEHVRFAATDGTSVDLYTSQWSSPPISDMSDHEAPTHAVNADCMVQKTSAVSKSEFATDTRAAWAATVGKLPP